MGFWNFRKAKREESALERIARARSILSNIRAQPDFGCDVCGPYAHYHYSCCNAVRCAIKGLLIFRCRQFEEPAFDLKSLTTLAFEGLSDRDRCLGIVNRLVAYPGFDFGDGPPTQAMLDDIFLLAEEIIATITSVLPAK